MRVPALAVLLMATSCGGVQRRTAPTIASTPTPRGEVREFEGLRLVTLPAPTRGWVHLSLWIDAGSRDAEPPQLATISAWLAATEAEAEARVVPDGTELRRDCPTEELEACVATLLGALSERDVTPDALAAALRRLRRARRSSRSDAGRVADESALAALFGDDLSPFGSIEADAEVSPEAISNFRARHYGSGRVMLAAAGDLPAGGLAELAEGMALSLPTADAPRAPRPAPPGGAVGDVGDVGFAVVALGLGDGLTARAAAHRLGDPLTGGLAQVSQGAPYRVHAFEVRGSGVLLARIGPTATPQDVADGLLFAAERAIEGTEAAPPSSSADPRELARREGERWIAGAAGSHSSRAFALVLPGGRGDRLGSDDPDGPAREQALALAQRLLASEPASPPEPSSGLESGAGQVLGNGARIHLERRAGGTVSVALAFEAPAASESPVAHGRGAILARLVARTCGDADAGQLRERLRRWGAQLEPFRTNRGFGALLTAPTDRGAEATELLLACGLRPDTGRAALEAMRAEHLTALAADVHTSHRQWAATALAPAAASWVSPRGSSGSVGRLSPSGVAAAFDEAAVGARVSLSIVGDITGADALAWAAPRLRRLAPGASPPTPVAGSVGPELTPETFDDGTPRVLIGWRSDGNATGAGDGARAFAAAVGRRLTRRHGLAVRWQDGHADELGAWAAVVVEVPVARLDDLPTVARDIATAAGAEVASTLDAASNATRFRAASPGERAGDLALHAPPPASRARVLEWATRLGQAPPRFVVGRQHAPAAGRRIRRRRRGR